MRRGEDRSNAYVAEDDQESDGEPSAEEAGDAKSVSSDSSLDNNQLQKLSYGEYESYLSYRTAKQKVAGIRKARGFDGRSDSRGRTDRKKNIRSSQNSRRPRSRCRLSKPVVRDKRWSWARRRCWRRRRPKHRAGCSLSQTPPRKLLSRDISTRGEVRLRTSRSYSSCSLTTQLEPSS